MTPDESAYRYFKLAATMDAAECILGRPEVKSVEIAEVDEVGEWRIKFIVGPRASGKTFRQSLAITKLMMKFPGSIGVYAAPSMASLQDIVLPSVARLTPPGEFSGGSFEAAHSRRTTEICYSNGSRLCGVTFDNLVEHMGGFSCSVVAIDDLECARSQGTRVVTGALNMLRSALPDGTPAHIIAGVGAIPPWLQSVRRKVERIGAVGPITILNGTHGHDGGGAYDPDWMG